MTRIDFPPRPETRRLFFVRAAVELLGVLVPPSVGSRYAVSDLPADARLVAIELEEDQRTARLIFESAEVPEVPAEETIPERRVTIHTYDLTTADAECLTARGRCLDCGHLCAAHDPRLMLPDGTRRCAMPGCACTRWHPWDPSA